MTDPIKLYSTAHFKGHTTSEHREIDKPFLSNRPIHILQMRPLIDYDHALSIFHDLSPALPVCTLSNTHDLSPNYSRCLHSPLRVQSIVLLSNEKLDGVE